MSGQVRISEDRLSALAESPGSATLWEVRIMRLEILAARSEIEDIKREWESCCERERARWEAEKELRATPRPRREGDRMTAAHTDKVLPGILDGSNKAKCPKCGKMHPIILGKTDGKPSLTLCAVRCGKALYLVGFEGREIVSDET